MLPIYIPSLHSSNHPLYSALSGAEHAFHLYTYWCSLKIELMISSRCSQGTQSSVRRSSRAFQANSHNFRDHSFGTSDSSPQLSVKRRSGTRSSSSTPVHSYQTSGLTRAPTRAPCPTKRDGSPLERHPECLSERIESPETSVASSAFSRRLACQVPGVAVAALVFNAALAAKAVSADTVSPFLSVPGALWGGEDSPLTGTSPTVSNSVRLEAGSSAPAQPANQQSLSRAGSSGNTSPVVTSSAPNRPPSSMLDVNPFTPTILAPPSPPPPTPGLLSPSVKRVKGKYYVESRAPQVRSKWVQPCGSQAPTSHT